MKYTTTLKSESTKKYRSTCMRTLLAAAAILMIPVAADSQTLLLNFGNETITNWNKLESLNADLAAGAVIDNTGAVWAGVAVTTDNFGGINTSNFTSGYASGGTAAAWVNANALGTVWIRSGGSPGGTVVISGLDNSLTYSLSVVSARSSSSTNQGILTANGLASNIGNSAAFLGYQNGWVEGQILTWNSLSPTGGSITLNVNGSNSSNSGFIDALQLTASSVPEPSSYAILAAGCSLMVVAMRRKTRRG